MRSDEQVRWSSRVRFLSGVALGGALSFAGAWKLAEMALAPLEGTLRAQGSYRSEAPAKNSSDGGAALSGASVELVDVHFHAKKDGHLSIYLGNPEDGCSVPPLSSPDYRALFEYRLSSGLPEAHTVVCLPIQITAEKQLVAAKHYYGPLLRKTSASVEGGTGQNAVGQAVLTHIGTTPLRWELNSFIVDSAFTVMTEKCVVQQEQPSVSPYRSFFQADENPSIGPEKAIPKSSGFLRCTEEPRTQIVQTVLFEVHSANQNSEKWATQVSIPVKGVVANFIVPAHDNVE